MGDTPWLLRNYADCRLLKALIFLHRKIVDKIDKDQDGKITAKELGDWIQFSKTQHNQETVNKRWGELVVRLQSLLSQEDSAAGKTVDPDAPVSWEEYKTASYGEKPGIVK